MCATLPVLVRDAVDCSSPKTHTTKEVHPAQYLTVFPIEFSISCIMCVNLVVLLTLGITVNKTTWYQIDVNIRESYFP